MGKIDPNTGYDIKNQKRVVDVAFSMRRNSKQPLDESTLPKNYGALEELMRNPNSSIYKGQIVVVQDKDQTDQTYFSPWLIKNNSQSPTTYYTDRIMTLTYTDKYIGEMYVKKVQLGRTYTGVGQWIDGDEINPTITYTEKFNDYNGNKALPGTQPVYSHIEGKSNVVGSDYSHAEGSSNTIKDGSSNSHVEGNANTTYGNSANSHIEGHNNTIKNNSTNAHIEGDSNVASGKNAHVGGMNSATYGDLAFVHGKYSSASENSFALGDHIYSSGNGSLSHGIYTASYANASHTEGSYTLSYGENSHAEGLRTKSNGIGSHSEGISTISNGTGSHSEGINSKSIGNYSHSEGTSIANAAYSHSEGYSTVNQFGTYAHSEGRNTSTDSPYSHSEGQNTKILQSSDASHVEGNNNTISNSTNSHVEGENNSIISGHGNHVEGGSNTNITGTYVHVEGGRNSITETSANPSMMSHVEGSDNTLNTSSYAHIEGQNNSISLSNWSHAEGSNTSIESSTYAHAEGNGTQILKGSNGAHAEGKSTSVASLYSHAEGIGASVNTNSDGAHAEGSSSATGSLSHAEGSETATSGLASHSEGRSTRTVSQYAHSEGISTIANGEGSHSEGYLTTAGDILKDKTITKYSHSEGMNTYASGQASHSEGYLTRSYGPYSHSAGHGTIVHGGYSSGTGFYTIGTNNSEVSLGTYNRSYTTVSGIGGTVITNVNNEFARLSGKYIPGRYPTGINDNNNTSEAKYDESYTTVFSIGNGGSGAERDVNVSYDNPDGTSSINVNGVNNLKSSSRHNIMDIRKNGQMYYDGGMIIGGETVAPVSYSYVASLGPSAYLTTVMRALLVQPEYYRPSLQYAVWYTGSSSHNQVSSNNSVGWAYFQSNLNSDGICEVGASSNFTLRFRAFNVGVQKTKNLDPIYGNMLGNMLGYSTGITNISYQILNNSTNLSAQSFRSTSDNELLAGMNGTLASNYGPKKVDANNNDYGGFGPFDAFKEEYSKTGKHAPLAYYSSYCNAVDNKGAFGESNGNYNSGLYSTQQVVASSIKFDKEGKYTIWKATSYTFNAATQMYFQQLAEKGTYVPDNGVAPLDKFGKTTVNSSASFTMNIRYRIYYGVTNDVPSDSWKNWTQNDLLTKGQVAHGHTFGTMNANKGNVQSVTQGFNSTVKTAWFAFPEDIYKLTRYNTAAVPTSRFMWYKNAMNAESSLDTGRITDAVSSARPMYEYVTNAGINPSGLKYHIVAVSAPAGITKGTWGFSFERK